MPDRVVVLGDALLDRDLDGRAERLAPDAPVPVVRDAITTIRPGGASLAALLLQRDGVEVTLVTALGDDDAGRALTRILFDEGVTVVDLGRDGATTEKVRIRADGHPVVRVDSDGEVARLRSPERAAQCLGGRIPLLVADYGRGMTADPTVRALVAAHARRAPVVWDPHSLGDPPVAGCCVVTPNRAEAIAAGGRCDSIAGIAAIAADLAAAWHVTAVAVTLGEDGALLGIPGRAPLVVRAPVRASGDPCGAGDRFASAVVAALAAGCVLHEAVQEGVQRATEFVAGGGVSSLALAPQPVPVRASLGGRARPATVVATSGCFDLLHAGHVASLRAARALGDRLVVLLNSDASVRRLKGPGRPLVPAADRAAVLGGLACVDSVEIFDDDTPLRALEVLKPQLFVKGGDYGAVDIPEQHAMAQWGGQVVIVPYLPGHSTTRILEEARGAA
jgi:rfaE bifunctional protein nucleotidyltransferase chain/domain/rfaE bifunctional protein kinase chain/domain